MLELAQIFEFLLYYFLFRVHCQHYYIVARIYHILKYPVQDYKSQSQNYHTNYYNIEEELRFLFNLLGHDGADIIGTLKHFCEMIVIGEE